jgi:hypothetical protein
MPYYQANVSNLKQLLATALATKYDISLNVVTTANTNADKIKQLNTWIHDFLENPIEANYPNVKLALDNVFDSQKVGDASIAGIRYLLTASDGRVIYDSKHRDDVTKHTWSNYKNSPTTIAENHSSRPEIMQAFLSSSGTGIAKRYSSTEAALTYYIATRLGSGPDSPDGIFRLSLNV